MIIQLSDQIERSIVAAVRDGRFPSVDEAVAAAWLAFNSEAIPASAHLVRTPDEFHRQLLAAGIISHLPNPAEDVGDDEPVIIDGEPLSATIIRERR